jgi:hypothetical protein
LSAETPSTVVSCRGPGSLLSLSAEVPSTTGSCRAPGSLLSC